MKVLCGLSSNIVWLYVLFSSTNVINSCYSVVYSRSVSGVDVDPDLVHMEMQDTSGGTVIMHMHI